MKMTRTEKVSQLVILLVLVFISLTVILPFMHIIAVSLSSRQGSATLGIGIVPDTINLQGYQNILREPAFLRSMVNTVGVTVVGTVLSLATTVTLAYCLTRNFYGKTFVKYYFVITMYFSGGMIPWFLLISRYLHWNNSFLPYILPSLVNVYYAIVIRTQIEQVPPSLFEAAHIDGASEFKLLVRVVLPTILPTLAAIGMFFALAYWNLWYPVMLFARKDSYWTLQYFLRVVVFEKFIGTATSMSGGIDISSISDVSTQNYQMACVVVVALPIVAIYPFVQKYFVKGILAGSVKE